LDEKIRDDKLERKKDCGKLSKHRKPSLDVLEHREMKKKRQAGEAQKKRVKLT
jgi:hypothetical protein